MAGIGTPALSSSSNLTIGTGDNVIGRVKITDGTEVANVNASNQLEVSVENTPTVTANAGTNLNTSALALESGGNLATIAGDTTSLDAKLAALVDMDSGAGTDNRQAVGMLLQKSGGAVLATPATGTYGEMPLVMVPHDTSALSDDFANTVAGPTDENFNRLFFPSLGFVYDGSTWDRMRGTSTDGVLVNLGSNNDITGTVTANAGTNLNTSALALESGGNLATIAGDTTSLDGKVTACNTGAVVLAAGTAVVGKMRLVTATGDEVTEDTDNSVNVTIVADDAGVGGGTQYTEDNEVPANPIGTAMMMERDDALGGLTPVAGDWTHPFCDANGALWTHDDALDAALSGSELQVDVVAALPAGDNNIGNVDIASSVALDVSAATVTVDLGANNDVTLATLPDTADGDLADIETNTDSLAVVGGGAEATALRVTIANDSTGVVSVDDGGGALTVDGTVTANAGTNLNTSALALEAGGNLAAVATSLGNIDNAVDGNYLNVNMNFAGSDAQAGEGTISATTQRVTIATDDDGVAHLATIAGDTTAIQTAIEKIDGAVIGPGEPTIDSYTQVAINLNAGANQVLVSSAASKQIWVYSVAYTVSVDGTVSFQDEDDTAITGIMDHAANSGLALGPSGNFAMPIWKLATNKDLEVDVVDAALDGFLSYAIVSV